MTARLVRALDTMRAVWGETRVWDRHLAGEGPATLRRQRKAAAAARAADPPESPESQGRPAGGRMSRRRGAPGGVSDRARAARPARPWPRNLKVAPAFFHNGAFGTLEGAIAHHLDVEASLRHYDPHANAVPADLSSGPFEAILAAGIGPLLPTAIVLTDRESRGLVEFVRDGLFDRRVRRFCEHLPRAVPSGMPLQRFEGCPHEDRPAVR